MNQVIAVLNEAGSLLGFFTFAGLSCAFDATKQAGASNVSEVLATLQSGPLYFKTEVSDEHDTKHKTISRTVTPDDPDYTFAAIQLLRSKGYVAETIAEQLKHPLMLLDQAKLPAEERRSTMESVMSMGPEEARAFLNELSEISGSLKTLKPGF